MLFSHERALWHIRVRLRKVCWGSAGLSLGDRACLALAQQLNLPAITADRVWEGVVEDVAVHLIR